MSLTYTLSYELVKGLLCILVIISLLRITGKKTLNKMNAFDFILTLAIGSTLSTIIVNKQLTIIEGVVALALLVSVQYVVSWLEVRFDKVQKIVNSTPTLLFSEGKFKEQIMHAERVTKEEVLMAMRFQGIADPSEVDFVLLEADGRLSVIPNKTKDNPLRAIDANK